VAGAGFRGLLLIYLLNLTINKKLASQTLHFASKYQVFLNQLSAQTRDHIHRSSRYGGHILYCSRIRKNVTENGEQMDRQKDNRESNYRGQSNHRWIVGLSGPILSGDFKDREQTLPVGGFVKNWTLYWKFYHRTYKTQIIVLFSLKE